MKLKNKAIIIKDDKGKKQYVVISYKDYKRIKEILEDIEDLETLNKATKENEDKPYYSLEEVKEKLFK